MKKQKPIVALIYDFDGTLAAGNMQEYDFTKAVDCEPKDFWSKNSNMSREQNASEILCYMKLMIDESNKANPPKRITKATFKDYGKSIQFYPGVQDWFDKINNYGDSLGLTIEHYINSSGLQEMIEGTTIAKKFKKIYASRFMYDVNGVAFWPAVAVDFTNKTQYLYMINKNIENVCDNKDINKHMEDEAKRVPFTHMIYFGDGETDVPCMKLLKQEGGYSIAVYEESNENKFKTAQDLVKRGVVNFACKADYQADSMMEASVKAILGQIKQMDEFDQIQKENQQSTKSGNISKHSNSIDRIINKAKAMKNKWQHG